MGTTDQAYVIDWPTGAEVSAFALYRGSDTRDFPPYFNSPYFSDDGKSVMLFSHVENLNELRMMPVPWQPDQLIELACSHLSRNSSRDEWRNNLGAIEYHVTCPGLPVPPGR